MTIEEKEKLLKDIQSFIDAQKGEAEPYQLLHYFLAIKVLEEWESKWTKQSVLEELTNAFNNNRYSPKSVYRTYRFSRFTKYDSKYIKENLPTLFTEVLPQSWFALLQQDMRAYFKNEKPDYYNDPDIEKILQANYEASIARRLGKKAQTVKNIGTLKPFYKTLAPYNTGPEYFNLNPQPLLHLEKGS